jgi:rod shape-determining protein MreD
VALLVQLLIARYLRFRPYLGYLRYLDLVLLVTVYVSFARNPVHTMLLGAFAGLVQDSFSQGIVGTNSFTKTVIGFFASVLSIRVALDNPVPRLIVLAGAAAANGLIYLGMHRLFGQNLLAGAGPILPRLGAEIGWLVGINAGAAIFLFRMLDYFLVKRERERSPGKPAKRRY